MEQGNFYCCLCGCIVGMDEVYPHMVLKHLDQDGGGCGSCNFCTTWNYVNVKYHLETEKLADAWKILDRQGLHSDRMHDFDVKKWLPARTTRKSAREEIETGQGDGRRCPSYTNGEIQSVRKNCFAPKFCQICKKLVLVQFKRHILVHHLKKPVWLCPYCSYSSTSEQRNVRYHIRSHHPNQPLSFIVDRRSEYQREIAELIAQAFPNKTKVGCERKRQEENENGEDGNEQGQGSVAGEDRLELETTLESAECSGTTLPGANGESESAESNNLSTTPSKYCQICNKLVFHQFRRHILTHHLKKPVFCCPYCKYCSTSEQKSVYQHIRCRHPKKPLSIIDRRREYKEEIVELEARAFPSNSLETHCARKYSSTSSKRCQICEQMVAGHFSRHVLLYHLKKPVWCCPYCTYSSPSEQRNVRHHIRCQHPNKPLSFIDRRSEYEEKIAELTARAFPNKTEMGSEGKRQEENENREGGDDQELCCQICKKLVFHRFRHHILAHHLKEPVWCCPYCNYSNSYDSRKVRKHIGCRHPKEPLYVVDRRSEYREQIRELEARAYPNKTQVGCFRKREVIEDSCIAELQAAGEDQVEVELPGVPSPPGLGSDSNSSVCPSRCKQCQICKQMVVANFSRHILVHHLKKPVWCCRYCSYSSTGEQKSVRTHILSQHPNQPVSFLNRRSEYKDEIAELMAKAFHKRRKSRSVVGKASDTKVGKKRVENCSGQPQVPGEDNLQLDIVAEVPSPGAEQQRKKEMLGFPTKTRGGEQFTEPVSACEAVRAMVSVTSVVLPTDVKITGWKRTWYWPVKGDSCSGRDTATKIRGGKKSVPSDCKICQLCNQWVRGHLKRHVVMEHLKKSVWCCPYCKYTSSYQPGCVRKHIVSRHPNKPLSVVDKTSKYKEEIAELMNRAFPNGTHMASFPKPEKRKEKMGMIRNVTMGMTV